MKLRAVRYKQTDGQYWQVVDADTDRLLARGFESEDEAMAYIATMTRLTADQKGEQQ